MSDTLRSGAAELPPVCRLVGESAARLHGGGMRGSMALSENVHSSADFLQG